VRERVLGRRHPARAEDLDALVVAVDRLARVVDRGQAAVGVLEQHDRGVDVAGLPDLRVDAHPAAGVDLDDLRAGDVPGHVEVVDGHVQEQAAGAADVAHRRGRRVAAGDPRELRLADLPGRHGGGHGLVGRVEAAVEADLERHAGGVDGGERAVDLGEVERHRLLAEDRLAGLRRRDDQLGVRVGRRADRDGVDVGRVEQLVEVRRHDGAERLGHRPGARLELVVDPGHRGARHLAGEQLGVHAPDPPDADDADPERGGRGRLHQSSRSDTTSSQCPDSADRSSAACTLTHSTASAKPGSCSRPAATERQYS
jgi:hypothetical protein